MRCKLQSTILSICIVLLSISGQSQSCDSIVLNNQADINNFIKNYGNCTTVRDLVITNRDNDITQLDSLYTIERITGSILFTNRLQGGREINISAFKRLRYLNDMGSYYSIIYTGQFLALDTINYLNFDTSFYTYPNLKHIGKYMYVGRPFLTEEKTPTFTTGQNFELSLTDTDTATLKVLSKRIKTSHLKSLTVGPYYKRIDLSYLPILDSLEYLKLAICHNSNLRQISTIRKLKKLIIDSDDGGNDYGLGLIHIKELDELWLSDRKPLRPFASTDYKKILPNLEAINKRLYVASTDSLFNLDFLDNVRPPHASTPPNPNYGYSNDLIVLIENRFLNYCKSIFMCKAIKQYPERIYIKDNYASRCTLEDIAKYCETVSIDDKQIRSLSLSPNPTYGIVQIREVHDPVQVRILNIQGTIVKTLQNCTGEIDISDLPSGLYVFDIAYQGKTEKHKIVKIN